MRRGALRLAVVALVALGSSVLAVPLIAVSRLSVSFAGYGDEALSDSVVLENASLDAPTNVTALTPQAPWLSTQPNSTFILASRGGSRTVLMRVNASSLPAGNYTTALTISHTAVPAAPLVVNVSLRVLAGMLFEFSAAILSGPSTGTLIEGQSAPFRVRPRTAPTANVSVNVSLSDASVLTIGPPPFLFSFTPASWRVAQQLTVTAPNDSRVGGNRSATLSFAIASSDSAFGALSQPPLVVSVIEDDYVGLWTNLSTRHFDLREGSLPMAFLLRLHSEPSAPVVITWPSNAALSTEAAAAVNVSAGRQVQVEPASLVFTSATWNTPALVLVSAVDDAVIEGFHFATLDLAQETGSIVSADPLYNELAEAPWTFNITDNDNEYEMAWPLVAEKVGGTFVDVSFPGNVSFQDASAVSLAALPVVEGWFRDALDESLPVNCTVRTLRSVRCLSPPCQLVPPFDVDCRSPVSLEVLVNGQRSTRNAQVTYFLPPELSAIVPSEGDIGATTIITILGSNLLNSSSARCSVGGFPASAVFVRVEGEGALLCAAPPRPDLRGTIDGEAVEVRVSLSGQSYSASRATFLYFDADTQRDRRIWLVFWVIVNLIGLSMLVFCLWDCCIRRNPLQIEQRVEAELLVGPQRLLDKIEEEREHLLSSQEAKLQTDGQSAPPAPQSADEVFSDRKAELVYKALRAPASPPEARKLAQGSTLEPPGSDAASFASYRSRAASIQMMPSAASLPRLSTMHAAAVLVPAGGSACGPRELSPVPLQQASLPATTPPQPESP